MKHKIQSLTFSESHLRLRVDGKGYVIDLPLCSEKLARGSKIERTAFRVSPSGYEIHWPLLDEDLTVDGLIRAASQGKLIKKSA